MKRCLKIKIQKDKGDKNDEEGRRMSSSVFSL